MISVNVGLIACRAFNHRSFTSAFCTGRAVLARLARFDVSSTALRCLLTEVDMLSLLGTMHGKL